MRPVPLRPGRNGHVYARNDDGGIRQPSEADYGVFDGWTANDVAIGPDGVARLLWTFYDGHAAVWLTDSLGNYVSNVAIGPIGGKSAIALAVDSRNNPAVLWTGAEGSADITCVGPIGVTQTVSIPGQTGYQPRGLFFGPNGQVCLVSSGAGLAAINVVGSSGVVERQIVIKEPTVWSAISAYYAADGNVRILWKNKINGAARLSIVDFETGGVTANFDYAAFVNS